jgi:hypothetical protein
MLAPFLRCIAKLIFCFKYIIALPSPVLSTIFLQFVQDTWNTLYIVADIVILLELIKLLNVNTITE